MRVLGIDPGFGRTGWGVVETDGKTLIPKFLACGCIETEPNLEFSKRILKLADSLEQILQNYKPDFIATEKLFFSKNVKTAMQVGEARGVVLLIAARAGIMVSEFAPTVVKSSVAGWGGAGKQQVGKMVQVLLKLKQVPKPDDAADALAIAITGLAYGPTLNKYEESKKAFLAKIKKIKK